jgi:hypothetical protein
MKYISFKSLLRFVIHFDILLTWKYRLLRVAVYVFCTINCFHIRHILVYVSLLYMKLYSYNFTDGFAFSQEEGGAVTQSEVIRAYNTNLPKPGGMWNMNRNGDDLHQHKFGIDLVSFLLSLRFPEVPMSHIVTHMLALSKESLRSKYRSELETTLFCCSLCI